MIYFLAGLLVFPACVLLGVGLIALVQNNRSVVRRERQMELDDWTLIDAEWRELSERCYREGRL